MGDIAVGLYKRVPRLSKIPCSRFLALILVLFDSTITEDEVDENHAGDDDDDLARVKHGLDADGEGHAGDLGDVVAEEAGVGEDGVVRERLDARPRREG